MESIDLMHKEVEQVKNNFRNSIVVGALTLVILFLPNVIQVSPGIFYVVGSITAFCTFVIMWRGRREYTLPAYLCVLFSIFTFGLACYAIAIPEFTLGNLLLSIFSFIFTAILFFWELIKQEDEICDVYLS